MIAVAPILPGVHGTTPVAITGQPVSDTTPEGVVLRPIPGLLLKDGVTIVTRWQLTDDERGKLLAGCDLWVTIVSTGDGLHPMQLTLGPPELDR